MKEVPLTQGKVALVDDGDYEWLMQWRWQAMKPSNPKRCWYAARGEYFPDTKKQKTVWMHRFILGLPHGKKPHVDHRDRNGLNNQRSNLRIATHGDNTHNQRIYSTNKSGFRGVFWSKRGNKWQAEIDCNGKTFYLGRFSDVREAAIAYNEAALYHHGEFASLNIIPSA